MSKAIRENPRMIGLAAKIVEHFTQNTPGVQAVVLTTNDGFEVASARLEKSKAGKLAALGSSLQAVSEAISRESGLKSVSNVFIETENGTVILARVAGVTGGMTLAMVASQSAVLGHLVWAARNCCTALTRVFQS